MKTVIYTSTFLLITLYTQSQKQVNPEKVLNIGEFKHWIYGEDTSGWDFDNEQWMERKGYLRVGDEVGFIDIAEKYEQIKTEAKSRTPQNFNDLGIIKVSFKGEEYIGFGIEKVEGRYRYPAIPKDYYTYLSFYIYLFKENELQKLDKIEGEVVLNVFLGTKGDPLLKDKEYQSCYANLKTLFEYGKNLENEFVKFKKHTYIEGMEVVRFLLPQIISRYNEPIDFDNHYFEVTLQEFNELRSSIFN